MNRSTEPRSSNPSPDPVLAALIRARHRRRMSRRQVAAAMGRKGEGTIRRWEDGSITPGLSNLHEWARALGLQITTERLP